MSFSAANEALELTAKYDYPWEYTDKSSIDISKSSGKIYTTNSGYLKIFNSKMELLNSVTLPMDKIGDDYIRYIKSIDDRVFAIGTDGEVYLYDIVDEKLIAQTPTIYTLSNSFNCSVSADGNFVAFIFDDLYVYELKNKLEFILRHRIAGKFYGCFFAPNDGNKLILNTLNDVEIFNCATGIVDQVIDRIYANPINIDPVTGYMLLVSNSKKKIYVYDYKNDLLVFEMNHHAFAYDFKLLNNHIFFNSGYHIDISSYANN
jgi:DNA-binding beta-propeller fold protein YncE